MRSTILVVLLGSFGWGQSLLEHSAAAAGGSVGGVAGKKVSDGLTAIFEKVDKTTQKAAKGPKGTAANTPDTSAPILEVGPGVPKQRASVPPPPPPIRNAAVHKAPPLPLTIHAVPVPAPQIQQTEIAKVSTDELRTVKAGMKRGDVLKLGTPTARITMYDDGHLVEIYRYLEQDTNIGVVRLTDGSVSSVLVQ